MTMPPQLLLVLKSRWLHYGLLALACVLLWLRGNAWERTSGSWETAYTNQKAAYESAQSAARDKLLAQKLRLENDYARSARSAKDPEHDRRMDGAASAYARTHRLRPEEARRLSGGTPASGEGGTPEGGDRPGEAPEMVAVTRNEFDDFVSAVKRLDEVKRWGDSLILQGLAIPEVEFGKEVAQ